MKQPTLDTELVFRDIRRANKKLRNQHKIPDAVRRRFSDFVTLSQKLTAAMYKEYETLTSQKWDASAFPGWTPVTNLFKKLRNTDLHELPIRITIKQTQIYHGVEISTDKLGNEAETPVEMHIKVHYTSEAGLEKKLPQSLIATFTDQDGAKQKIQTPHERHFEFEVEGITPQVERWIQASGTRDVHKLAAQCFATLSDYYEFYRTQLMSNAKL